MVNLVTVTGNISDLTGITPQAARIWFEFPRPDWDEDGNIFAPGPVQIIAANDGSFTVNLQSTDGLQNGGAYTATLRYFDPLTGKPKDHVMAAFAVPAGAGPYDLADLLVAGTIAPVPADILALAQAAQVAATAAAAQAVAFGSIYTQTDAQLLSVTIPADVDVVQRMPSVAGQVAPPNIVSRWRRNASPGSEAFWTDATGANFTVAEITQAEILSTLTSALDAAFTDPAFSGQTRIANGTQSAPSLAFASDLDTGIYYQNTNSIGFTAGGTRRAFLSSTAMQVDVPITGTAVTSSNDDDTPGRLMKTGDGGILGSGILLTGATDLKDRALEGGLYGYSANVVTGGPETAAWAHALFANHNDTANRRGFLDIRLTSGTNIRAWIGSNASDTGVIDWFEILTTNAIPPGPFADDVAAAAGGVQVGRMYRKTGGDMAWRVS